MPRRHIPRLSYHRAQQRWYVTLDGKEHYLHKGKLPRTKTPPPEVRAAYDRALAAWLSARAVQPETVGVDPTVDELWLGYLSTIEGGAKYHKRGKPTSEVQLIRDACRIAARLFGELPAREFGPLRLEAVRAEFMRQEWTRESVNKATRRVKRMFRWGLSRELVPEMVYRALLALPDLSEAEYPHGDKKIGNVADDVLEATVGHLTANLAAMVRVHRRIGCRAQEIVVARTCDFDLTADTDDIPVAQRCWLFTPVESKTGESYWVGPIAQHILRPLLKPDNPTAWLFPTNASNRRGRGCWSTGSYRNRIAQCCAEHGIPLWTPVQIRHAAAEEARQKHPAGLEATQARLRHKEMSMSARYAHNLSSLGRDVARCFG